MTQRFKIHQAVQLTTEYPHRFSVRDKENGTLVAQHLTHDQAQVVAKALNELPAEREFRFQVRAVRHLTAEIVIVAADEEAARTRAKARSNNGHIAWDESHAEDFSIESVELTP